VSAVFLHQPCRDRSDRRVGHPGLPARPALSGRGAGRNGLVLLRLRLGVLLASAAYLVLRGVVGGRDRFGRRFTLVRGGFGGCPPPARRKRFGLPLVVGSTLGGSDRPGPLLVLGRGTGGHPAGRRVVGAHGREDVGIGPFLVRATLPGRRGIAVHPPAADGHADDPREEHAQRGEGREGSQFVEDAPGVKTLVHQRDEPANR